MMDIVTVILAAGRGTRMKSKLPKVLHPLCGRSLLAHVFYTVAKTGASHFIPILGHERDAVAEEISAHAAKNGWKVSAVVQEDQKGTGHALQMAIPVLQALPPKQKVLILNGDGPLLEPESLLAMAKTHLKMKNALTMGVMDVANPAGYGRILGTRGRILKIVEEKEATQPQKKIRHVNGGVYLCSAELLLACLKDLKPSPTTKEIYLTDIVAAVNKRRLRVGEHLFCETELQGVNDLSQLAAAEAQLRKRVLQQWLLAGVRMQDPASTYIDMNVALEAGVVLEPGVVLKGNTHIGSDSLIRAYSYIEDANIAANVQIGPFARIRPETKISSGAKIGNFVEIKKTNIGAGSKVSHLSYLGDAEVGADVNIGCGFITCNYDGEKKHKTTIADGAFIGSDVQAVAPLSVGKNAYVASGSTLTRDVPEDALAIARVKQENKAEYAAKIRSRLQARNKK